MTDWKVGDRFRYRGDGANGLVFELSRRGLRRGRPPRGGARGDRDGWYFWAPRIDAFRDSRWMRTVDLRDDKFERVSGDVRLIPVKAPAR